MPKHDGWTIIDGDGHVRERDAEIRDYLDAPYRDNDVILNFPFFPTLDGFHRGFGGVKAGKREGRVDAQDWLSVMDEVGIHSTVLYPTAGLGYGLIQDPEWAVALGRGYNNWFSESFYRKSKRLRGVALIPLQDVDEAVKELRRAVTELGMVSAILPANGGDVGLRKPLGDRSYWPVYAEAERLNVPLVVHGAPSTGLGFDFFTTVRQAAALEHPISLMIQLTNMAWSGLFDEFPNLRMGYFEAGGGWVPYMMDRLDRGYREGAPGHPKQRPSELIASGRIFFSVEGGEESLKYAIERISDDVFVYASDYPHESIHAVAHEIDEMIERPDLAESSKRKIFNDNIHRFYQYAD